MLRCSKKELDLLSFGSSLKSISSFDRASTFTHLFVRKNAFQESFVLRNLQHVQLASSPSNVADRTIKMAFQETGIPPQIPPSNSGFELARLQPVQQLKFLKVIKTKSFLKDVSLRWTIVEAFRLLRLVSSKVGLKNIYLFAFLRGLVTLLGGIESGSVR